MSSYDIQEAFGSVSHTLIPFVLKHYNVPENVIKYVEDLYSKLSGVVQTKQWSSIPFKFRRGVFQGDPYSPIICLVTFNPQAQGNTPEVTGRHPIKSWFYGFYFKTQEV